MATVSGTITNASGTAYTGDVRFALQECPGVQGSAVISGASVSAACDALGAFSLSLVSGYYLVDMDGAAAFRVYVGTDAAYDLSDLVNASPAAFVLDRLYGWNQTTGKYHEITVRGIGSEVGFAFDTTGSLNPSEASRKDRTWMYNQDDGLYYEFRITGSGSEIGIAFYTGTSLTDVPAAWKIDSLMMYDTDDGKYYRATLRGSGSEMGLVFA